MDAFFDSLQGQVFFSMAPFPGLVECDFNRFYTWYYLYELMGTAECIPFQRGKNSVFGFLSFEDGGGETKQDKLWGESA